MKISLVILALNELESSKKIAPRIDKNLFDEILVIDGGSNDGTDTYFKSLGFQVIKQTNFPNTYFKIAERQKKIAEAYWQGVNKALGDIVIIPFTTDGNMLPEKLPELINKMKQGYDLVCVSRYKNDAKSYDDTFISAFGNWFFTKLVNILFKGNFTDVLGGYKAVKRNLLMRVYSDKKTMISFGTQISISCLKNNLKYSEIPGDEPKRIAGKSSTSAIINGVIELFTILQAFFLKDLYKFKD